MSIGELSSKTKYPYIPDDLIQHARQLRQQHVQSRFLDQLDEDPPATSAAINKMFEQAAKATSQSAAEVLDGTDFKWQDTDPVRVDAAFAEVRTINILDVQGFSEIQQITATSRRSADLVATRRNEKFAIEVADSVYYASGRFTPDQIGDWIFERYQAQGKGTQLSNTAAELSCHRRVFAGIMDSAWTVALQEAPEFVAAAESAWKRIGKDPALHIAIFTGRVSAFAGPDDTVFPPWP